MLNEVLNHVHYVFPGYDVHSTITDLDSELLPGPLDHGFKLQTTAQQRRWFHTDINISTLQAYERFRLGNGMVIGSSKSQRRGDINRNNHIVCFRTSNGELCVGEIYYFADCAGLTVMDHQYWAWIKQYNAAQWDTRTGVASIATGMHGNRRWIPMEWVISAAGLIQQAGLQIVVSDVPELML